MRLPTLKVFTTVASALALSGCSDPHRLTAPARLGASKSSADRAIGTTFVSIDPPGSTLTLATDINARGQIVGRQLSAGKTHGFLREPDGTITTIDYPGSGFTVAGSINNSGTIVGWYTLPAAPAVRHGFLLRDGVFTSFDPPGSAFTNPLGVNERGDIVGRFRPAGGPAFHGFVYHDGEFTTLDVPGASESDAFKVEANGAIVGGFNEGGAERLFVYGHGEFSTFGLPNGKNVTLDNGGANARGDIVGTYCDLPGICVVGSISTHGFLWSDGELMRIDYPGAQATATLGINEEGDIVGGYTDANGAPRGFLLSRP
jgi:uncharacterized membrane protein